VRGLDDRMPPLLARLEDDGAPEAALPEMSLGEHVANDYVTLGLSLKRHPLALLRPAFDPARVVQASRLNRASRSCRPIAACASPGLSSCASVRAAPDCTCEVAPWNRE
jgi:hypothetical protein